MIKRRSAIEPTIGHMKMDGKLARNNTHYTHIKFVTDKRRF